jgi:hypothetical protein
MSKSTSNHHTRRKIHFPYEIIVLCETNPSILQSSALPFLQSYRIPSDHIHYCIQSPSQIHAYKEILRPGTFSQILCPPSSHPAEVFNWVHTHFLPGTQLVFIHESVTNCMEYNEDAPTHVSRLTSFLEMIRFGFMECKRSDATLWGIYPAPAPTYLHDRVTTCLKQIPNTIWGCINPGPLIRLTVPVYTDYERSILYFLKDKAVVRLNMYAAILHSSSTYPTKQIQQSANRLFVTYPNLVSMQPSKDSEIPILRLNHTAVNE